MNQTTVFIGLAILILFYYVLSEALLKRKWKIQRKTLSPFTKGRPRLFVSIEVLLFLLFLFTNFWLITSDSNVLRAMPLFLFFFLLFLTRGVEGWIRFRQEKSYLHEWLGALLVVISFLWLLYSYFQFFSF
ncbi:DUF4181 domain-containing protein [Alkalihalobacterium bogoriense]|uniref:DUF4181 domain-containing protein n=1 Tax=Alkalihalobacterium bogoriense TaxID=246272 RepID=UPI000684423C|nr:DUF4181 domain-containing protein [Alkalihalobacterium bogoriense]